MSRAYDAIVVGGRCAGSPTAMLLARNGYRVLLVDRATFPSDTVSTHAVHVGGSARLARDLPESERPHIEGAVDAAVWSVAAAAALLSTVVMSAGGYVTLTAVACAVAIVATFTQLRWRSGAPAS